MDLFGMYGAKQDAPEPSPEPFVEPEPWATQEIIPRAHPVDHELERYVAELGDVADGRHLMRPYARTGGRTRPTLDLALETLVTTCDTARYTPPADATHRFVCDLSREPRSVAEISALLRVPLGVAKILIADLVVIGLVAISQNEALVNGPSLQLMERVLAGLQNL